MVHRRPGVHGPSKSGPGKVRRPIGAPPVVPKIKDLQDTRERGVMWDVQMRCARGVGDVVEVGCSRRGVVVEEEV